MTDMTDPRVIEYRAARASLRLGLSAPAGAHDRYRAAIAPYLTATAEMTPADTLLRRYLMAALFYDSRLPLASIAAAFRASEREMEWIEAQAPEYQPEPVDEQERLAAMPYGLYLKTPHWHNVRKAALERAGHACTICNRKTGLEVHHRTYKRRGAERPADVTVLCAGCHTRHHGSLRAA